jgi:hypothetical protein
MFLIEKNTHNLVEVLSTQELFDPFCKGVTAQSHAGEELQEPEAFLKAELVFPSGEELPRCWVDPNYRGTQMKVVAQVAW